MMRNSTEFPADLQALLTRLDDGLSQLYDSRYEGLILYGSYARGEADEGSDVDLLLLLEGEVDPARELRTADEIKWPLSLESGYTLSLIPVSITAFLNSGEPFLYNARTEGVPAARVIV